MYRVGGISGLSLGLAYLVIIALYIRVGVPPSDVEARLTYLAKSPFTWWAIVGLSVLTDFLFILVALSLYVALEQINRTLMLLATACVALFVVLDLAITRTNYAALIMLSSEYAKAANGIGKAAIITAAAYPALVLESKLLFIYNTLVLSVGILITGFVMLGGVFSRRHAYLGLLTGVLGVTSVVGSFFSSALSSIIIFASALTMIWIILVSYRLYSFSLKVHQ